MKTNIYGVVRLSCVVFLILGSTMVGCGGGGTGNIGIAEQSSSSSVHIEEISIDACSSQETITAKREEKLEISVEGGFGVPIDVVEANLKAKYSRGSSASIELPASPGTNMSFTVEWTDESFFGVIDLDGESGPAYEVHVSIPRQTGAYDQGCISGVYKLDQWVETPSPITLYMDVDSGLLVIDANGDAEWDLFIREKGEFPEPTPVITCKGRFEKTSKLLIGGPGGIARDWTFDMSGFSHDLRMAFCGWDVGGESDPFVLYPSQLGADQRILEMKNNRGTFIWEQ
jgi:hypothetical protein